MRIVIMSTDTKHHRYFIQKIHERHPVRAIFHERACLEKDYITGPFFSEEEHFFEERFFDQEFDGVFR